MRKTLATNGGDRLGHLERRSDPRQLQTARQVGLLLLNPRQVLVHFLQELFHLFPVLALGEEELVVRRLLLGAGAGAARGQPAAHIAREGGRRVLVLLIPAVALPVLVRVGAWQHVGQEGGGLHWDLDPLEGKEFRLLEDVVDPLQLGQLHVVLQRQGVEGVATMEHYYIQDSIGSVLRSWLIVIGSGSGEENK